MFRGSRGIQGGAGGGYRGTGVRWFHDGFTTLSLTNIITAFYAQLWFHDGFSGFIYGFSAYPLTNIRTAIYAQKWFHGWFHLVSVVAFANLGNIVYQIVTMRNGFNMVSIWFHYQLSEPI